jgi:S-adenosylmethionine synthetase
MPDERLERLVSRCFDLTPRGIITALKLKRPIYSPTAAYGHFGRKPFKAKVHGKPQEFFTWEQPSKVRALLSEAR